MRAQLRARGNLHYLYAISVARSFPRSYLHLSTFFDIFMRSHLRARGNLHYLLCVMKRAGEGGGCTI